MTGLSGPSVPPAAGGVAQQLVILLHGVAADGRDLIDLSQPLARSLPHARFVAPNAPEPCDMSPMGCQWFSLQDRTPATLIAGIQRNAPLLNAFIDAELAKDNLDDSKLALLGFSQGTMMSLYVAPRREKQMAAVVGYSGWMVGGDSLATEATSKPPTLLIHGDADNVVPIQGLHAAVQELQAAAIPVQWSVRPGLIHAIDPEGIAHGGSFLATAFNNTKGAR